MVPESPITRTESYLDAIINGETDVPEPETRIEQYLAWIALNGGGSGTTNYNSLQNKPQINGVTLSGDKSNDDLGIPIGGVTEDQWAAIELLLV